MSDRGLEENFKALKANAECNDETGSMLLVAQALWGIAMAIDRVGDKGGGLWAVATAINESKALGGVAEAISETGKTTSSGTFSEGTDH